MKLLHYYSGITLAVFIGIHLFNHLLVLHSEGLHYRFMQSARAIYRNPVIETLLLMAVLVQIFSGINLVISKWSKAVDQFDWIHLFSGLYLAFFLIFHVTAVMIGRYKLHMDTNLYYGAGVMTMWPQKLFFIPYYAFAILSFFFHVASVHRLKMEKYVTLSSATHQSYIIMGIGVLVALLIIVKMAFLKNTDFGNQIISLSSGQ